MSRFQPLDIRRKPMPSGSLATACCFVSGHRALLAVLVNVMRSLHG